MEAIPVLFVFFFLASAGVHPIAVIFLTACVAAFFMGASKNRKPSKPTYRGRWDQ